MARLSWPCLARVKLSFVGVLSDPLSRMKRLQVCLDRVDVSRMIAIEQLTHTHPHLLASK